MPEISIVLQFHSAYMTVSTMKSLGASSSSTAPHVRCPASSSFTPRRPSARSFAHVCHAKNEAEDLYKGIAVQSGIIERRLMVRVRNLAA